MKQNKPTQTFLYFFAAPGRIKIGIAGDVEKRRRDVGNHMAKPPKLIGHIVGSYHLEKHVHRLLKKHRLRGEWFKDCAEVRLVIDQLTVGGPDAVGFTPPPPKPEFVSKPIPLERRLAGLKMALEMMWPDDPIGEVVALTGHDAGTVHGWLEGEPIPPVVRCALSHLMLLMFSNMAVPSFLNPKDENE